MADKTIHSTTQQFLDIHDITNDMVIMKDGTTAVILTVDAMNFGLLAEEEQDAVMYAYAGLLNSLNYPIQIVIHSQTKDVTTYLQLLKDQEQLASTDIMRRRIEKYREFVANLIYERNVLDKKFYVTIPATPLELGLLTATSVVPGKSEFDISTVEKTMIIEKARGILEPKRDHLITQFGRIGLFSQQLTTQEIIQLFYIKYNPESAEGQQITDSNSYTTPLVQASIQGNLMNATNPVQPQQPTQPTGEAPASPSTPPVTPSTPPAPTPGAPSTPPTPAAPVTPPSSPPTPQDSPTTPPTATEDITPVSTPEGNQPVTPSTPPAPTPGAPSTPPTPTAPVTPPSSPATPQDSPISPPTESPTEAAAQEDINSTLQELSSTETTQPVGSAATTPSTPTNLPPVAEV